MPGKNGKNGFTAQVVKGSLIVTLPLVNVPSRTGKTTLVATTRGNKVTDIVVNGQNVILGVNAYIYER